MRFLLPDARRAAVRRLALTLLIAGLAVPAPAVAADGILGVSEASPRVFDGGSDGVRDATVITVELARPARTTVTVLDPQGRLVRTLQPATWLDAGVLTYGWAGRSASGALLSDGGFRVVIDVSDGVTSERREFSITKARSAIYPVNPAAIVVAIDPGHGGIDGGAARRGFREKTANLDIALRLRAMLEGAGVTVVMTRTSDAAVNVGRIDFNGDGSVTYKDELASRPHVANLARAAVFVSVHNNAARSSRPRGTATYYWHWRDYSLENRLLAGQVHAGIMASLRTIRRSGWRAVDHGLRSYPFAVLNDYGLLRPNPSLMPAILSEGLYVSNTADRGVLATEAGRQRIAAGMYDGLAAYFRLRTYGATYALEAGPDGGLVEGSTGSLRVRVTNTSPTAWADGTMSLALSSLPWKRFYDGSGATGEVLASVALPSLEPGASTVVEVPFAAPAWSALEGTAGRGLLYIDLMAGTDRLSRHGVVALQLEYVVLPAPPPPDPTPEPPPPSEPPTPDPPPSSDPPPPDPTPDPPPSSDPPPDPSLAP